MLSQPLLSSFARLEGSTGEEPAGKGVQLHVVLLRCRAGVLLRVSWQQLLWRRLPGTKNRTEQKQQDAIEALILR